MVSPLLILLGPPASGRGTQTRKLADHFGWKTFFIGNAIRQRIRDDQDFATPIAQATTMCGIHREVDAKGPVTAVEARLREIGSQFAAAT